MTGRGPRLAVLVIGALVAFALLFTHHGPLALVVMLVTLALVLLVPALRTKD